MGWRTAEPRGGTTPSPRPSRFPRKGQKSGSGPQASAADPLGLRWRAGWGWDTGVGVWGVHRGVAARQYSRAAVTSGKSGGWRCSLGAGA